MSQRFEFQREVPNPIVPGEYLTRDGRRAVIMEGKSSLIVYPLTGTIYGTISKKQEHPVTFYWHADGYANDGTSGADLMFIYKN